MWSSHTGLDIHDYVIDNLENLECDLDDSSYEYHFKNRVVPNGREHSVLEYAAFEDMTKNTSRGFITPFSPKLASELAYLPYQLISNKEDQKRGLLDSLIREYLREGFSVIYSSYCTE